MARKAQPPGWRPGGERLVYADDSAHDKPKIARNQAFDGLRFRHLIHHLHDLGPRPTGEFLAELGRRYDEREIAHQLEQYGVLDPAAVERLGGRDFPAPPLEPVA